MLSGMRTRLASTVLRPRGARLAGGGPSTPGGFIQDGPPKGGYPAVDVSRSLPGGGMSTLAAISTIGGLFVFGMYKIVLANRQRRCARTTGAHMCLPAHSRASCHVLSLFLF